MYTCACVLECVAPHTCLQEDAVDGQTLPLGGGCHGADIIGDTTGQLGKQAGGGGEVAEGGGMVKQECVSERPTARTV